MFLTFLMLLSLLVACTGPTGKPLRPVRAGETDLIVAVNGGGEDCGPGSCQGEMRLEVELRALGRALDSLEASSISVGVVTTRVSEGTPPWAFTLLPLSRDLSSVKSDLSRVPSNSVTLLNLGALVDQATIELARLRGCTSSGVQAERKRVLLFVNETPLLPYGPSFVDDNLKAGDRGAQRAARAGIKVFTVGFAPLEDRVQEELRRIARITGGRYEGVSDEAELSHALSAFTTEWSQKQ
jgi:hypothetical protein